MNRAKQNYVRCTRCRTLLVHPSLERTPDQTADVETLTLGVLHCRYCLVQEPVGAQASDGASAQEAAVVEQYIETYRPHVVVAERLRRIPWRLMRGGSTDLLPLKHVHTLAELIAKNLASRGIITRQPSSDRRVN